LILRVQMPGRQLVDLKFRGMMQLQRHRDPSVVLHVEYLSRSKEAQI
jgi:hypothetical protein